MKLSAFLAAHSPCQVRVARGFFGGARSVPSLGRSGIFSVALCLALATSALAPQAVAQPSGTVSVDKGNDGTIVGVIQVDQGDTWSDLSLASFNEVGTGAMASSSRVVNVSVHNTHATQDLFFLLRASGTTTKADSVKVIAGSTVSLTGLLKINGGQGSATVAVRGSGANTTGQIIVQVR